MRTVRQVAELTGVSVRTLHYYDQIGLLKPDKVTDAGYRLYDDTALARLQRILLYREVELPLDEVRRLLADETDRPRALAAQRELLSLRIERLQRLRALCERLMKGEPDMSFDAFDNTAIEQAKEKYREEARQRWGDTAAYQESEKKAAAYEKADWETIQKEENELFSAFPALRAQDATAPEAQALVRRWQEHITQRFYPCTREILQGLGQMYTADARFTENLDRFGAGTADFMSRAIAHYCEN